MIKRTPRRQRNRLAPDPADPPEPPTAAPIGPASGDLGAHYPNPTVVSLAHATIGPIIYPAGDGSLLTNVAPPATLKSGFGTLDGSGSLDMTGLTTANVAIGSWYNTPGAGKLITLGSPLRIASDQGATDAGLQICWLSF